MKAHGPNHQHDPKTKAIFEFLPGPVKIKDGLFMGDQIAARDIEFIISNKVTHVINTVSKQIPNLWERFGIHYLSVNWTEKQENIFDKKNNAVNTVFHFIEEAMEQGESCLIHSVNGKSRACAVTVAYLIKKYSWSLNKSLEFISSKKENLQIRNNYMQQMKQLEGRMSQIYKLTYDWVNLKNEEEIILANTFMNSKASNSSSIRDGEVKKNNHNKRVGFEEKPTIHKFGQNTHTNTRGKSSVKQSENKKKTPGKSILKGFQNQISVENSKIQQQSSNTEERISELENMTKMRKEGNLVNNINGNIVHVTVNNFISSQKKEQVGPVKNAANSRPYSSDQKDREKDKRDVKGINQKKILPYDPMSFSSSSKNPYQSKLGPQAQIRGGSSGKGLRQKRQEMTKTSYSGSSYQRPQSAKNRGGPGFHQMMGKEDLIITNGNSTGQGFPKKRYPSNPREGFFKRK